LAIRQQHPKQSDAKRKKGRKIKKGRRKNKKKGTQKGRRIKAETETEKGRLEQRYKER